MTMAESVAEPLLALSADAGARRERVRRCSAREVGLAPELRARYPHQLSGGQFQRAASRARWSWTGFVVCDEPVSALDVSVQGQIVNLLDRIRSERGAGKPLHQSQPRGRRASLRSRAGYVPRSYRGVGNRANILTAPCHPYTRELVDAVPQVDPGARQRLSQLTALHRATAVSPQPDAGCPFAARCPHVLPLCRAAAPARLAIGSAGCLSSRGRVARRPASVNAA